MFGSDDFEDIPALSGWLLEKTRQNLSARPPSSVTSLPPTNNPNGGTPYGLAAFRAECQAVAAAEIGTRNDKLNRAAFALGQLSAGGELADPDLMVTELMNAANTSGLPEAEAAKTVRSGFEAGQAQPRSAPKKDASRTTALPDSTSQEPKVEEPEARAEARVKVYETFDAADRTSWPCRDVEWLIKNVLARDHLSYEHGLAKTFKSFRVTDKAFCVAKGLPWLGKYETGQGRVLYCANEDRLRRFAARLGEIEIGYGKGPAPPGHLVFLPIRDQQDTSCRHLDLTDLIDRIAIIRAGKGFDLIVFDMIAYAMGDLDEDKKTDFGKFAMILREIQDATGAAIEGVEHDRKLGQNPRQRSNEPDPQELRGTGAKFGLVDSITSARRPTDERRVLVRIENRDHDEVIKLGVYIAPKDSGELKVSAFDLEKAAEANRAKGRDNKARVREALTEDPLSPKEVAKKVDLSASTVQDHLRTLLADGATVRSGDKSTGYFYSLPRKASEMDDASRMHGSNAIENMEIGFRDGSS